MAHYSRYRGQPDHDPRSYYYGREGWDDRYPRQHGRYAGAGPERDFANEDAGYAESRWYEDNSRGEMPPYLGESFITHGYGGATGPEVDVRRRFGAGSDYGDNRPGWNQDRGGYGDERYPRRGDYDWGHRHPSRNAGGPAAFAATAGVYRGRGPKGYSRKDERIVEDVSEALAQDPYLDASDIEVKVKDGIVTLRGETPSRQMKRRAEDCAESCSGVKDIENQIRVRPSETRNDADPAAR